LGRYDGAIIFARFSDDTRISRRRGLHSGGESYVTGTLGGRKRLEIGDQKQSPYGGVRPTARSVFGRVGYIFYKRARAPDTIITTRPGVRAVSFALKLNLRNRFSIISYSK